MTWVELRSRPEHLPDRRLDSWRCANELTHQLSERLTLGGEYSYRTGVARRAATASFDFQDAGGVVHLHARTAYHRRTSPAGSRCCTTATLDVTQDRPVRRGSASTHALERADARRSVRASVRAVVRVRRREQQPGAARLRADAARQDRLYIQGSAAWRRIEPFESRRARSSTRSGSARRSAMPRRGGRGSRRSTHITRQDSIVTGGEVDRHRVGVQFVVSQPMRIQ